MGLSYGKLSNYLPYNSFYGSSNAGVLPHSVLPHERQRVRGHATHRLMSPLRCDVV